MLKPKRIKFLKFIITSLLLLCGFSSLPQSKGVVIEEIIAKVDDYIILKSEFEKSYLDFLSSGEISGGNTKCRIIESLVINKMLLTKADQDSITVSDAEVESNLDRRMNYFISQIGSEEKIEEYYGKTIDQFKSELFDKIKEQLVTQRMRSEITSDIKVTPAEVKKFFNTIPADSLPFFSAEVTVGQIVHNPVPGKPQKQVVIDRLNEIRSRIIDGEDFGALARKYSQDPGSGSRGGELGFFKRGELAPEFEATAMSLNPGEISSPVETEFGFHIIELIERRGNIFNSRHILLTPQPSAKDFEKSRNFLDSLRTLIINDSISFNKAAAEYSDDKATSSSGGFFLDDSGVPRVSVENIDPVLFFTLDSMTIGTISKPLKFEQPNGNTAFRILYYKDRIPPHQAALSKDYQKIAQAALNQKKNLILSNWFSEAKADVFIDIDSDYDYCELNKEINN